MYVFLLLAIPAMVCFFCLSQAEYGWQSFVPPFLFGVLTAAVVYVVRKFIFFFSYLWTDSVLASLLYLFLADCVVPVVLSQLIFWIFSRDTGDYRLAALVPLLGGFYAVYVPFMVLTGDDALSTFMLFAKPLLYSGMIVLLGTLPRMARHAGKRIPLLLGTAAALLVPATVESVWYYTSFWTTVPFVCVAVAFALLAQAVQLVANRRSPAPSAPE